MEIQNRVTKYWTRTGGGDESGGTRTGGRDESGGTQTGDGYMRSLEKETYQEEMWMMCSNLMRLLVISDC